VITAAGGGLCAVSDVDTAAGLLALAVSHRHAMARHGDTFADIFDRGSMDRELDFIASALSPGR
jgi:hypothetical protein